MAKKWRAALVEAAAEYGGLLDVDREVPAKDLIEQALDVAHTAGRNEGRVAVHEDMRTATDAMLRDVAVQRLLDDDPVLQTTLVPRSRVTRMLDVVAQRERHAARAEVMQAVREAIAGVAG